VTTALATVLVKLAAVRRRAYAPPKIVVTLAAKENNTRESAVKETAAPAQPAAPTPSRRGGAC